MEAKRSTFSDRDLAALRAHLAPRQAPTAVTAHQLGRAAVTAGLGALDLVVIHERALRALGPTHELSTPDSRLRRRLALFFARALLPVHAERAIGEANRHLRQRVAALGRHTAEMAHGNRRLQREVARREAGEVKIERAKERYRTLFQQSQMMQEKLRQLTRQILSAQEEERKKISRELHDQVVQTLVGINVELTALGKGAAMDILTLKQRIAHTRRLVEKSVGAVHRFARELRPAVLDDIGLIPALHAYSQDLAARHGLRIQITAFGGVEALSIAKRTVLFRVAQEALNNVARHARASKVTLGISGRAGAIEMEIRDDGKSFPVVETLLAKNNKRLGLIGMRERIEMIGGHFTIESARGVGTTVRAGIPFKPEAKHP